MKLKSLIILLATLFIIACNKDNDLFEIMPQSDIEALEGMETAYESALAYNDSLILCADNQGTCDPLTIAHYDEQFHQFDDMFNLHHNNYSHNNMGDDHHHEGGNNIRHGWMMGDHDDDGHDDDDDDHEYDHDMDNFEMMNELREMHELVHPG